MGMKTRPKEIKSEYGYTESVAVRLARLKENNKNAEINTEIMGTLNRFLGKFY